MILENRIFDEISIGDEASLTRVLTQDDMFAFVAASGNHNPMHLPGLDANGDGQIDGFVPGLLIGSLISAVLGTRLPGPGTMYIGQTLEWSSRARAGDEMTAHVRVTEKHDDGTLTLDTWVMRSRDDRLVVSGQARVIAPQRKITADDAMFPGLIVDSHRHFEALLERARPLPALRTAVVCPDEANSLSGAVQAAVESIIDPILIGNAAKIRAAAEAGGMDISGYELIDEADDRKAATLAVALAREGKADAVMKGHLHTDDLLRPMIDKEKGLRIGRRFTHVFVLDIPGLSHLLTITDAAINIAPDLKTKVDIVQNAIDLVKSLGIETPRVGVLSAVETVNPEIQSSLDAALLSKMADRGQIRGGLVDGPLAMDNAVDLAAARTKGIKSEVAGRADILVVPNLDAGNMLAKQLTYISRAEAAGLVLGARVPVILNSRSDGRMSRLASCAVAALHHFNGKGAA
ncbi:MAG: bifunctional enoyl-CoA hydratase/phosphate acetyltransferase [Paracoccus sp. (in: a-proteobacteria)]|uniref:bifunctional enoyl-CoA hydratase/phosphate acetyltransferase n=1 Tax=Paracoccus sp. TaxID=267 RepID=UPI0026DF3327|nr:bifunctional enoyl-CoA hydratase/phosphate acetyltransferase [Paracoccus sp. (in: a-proteobacteria)]MDO5620520.1 bifunctional enoyl-CoA hydratase/phosphate acetyltransferase [Paracoccus sp. (in: a-proteobacteria)]